MLRQCCCSCCILIVILGVLTFTAWFVVRQFSPSKPIIYTVTNAMVTQFNLTAANTTLEYNLFVNMTVENPNKWSDFHYEYFDAVSSYKNLELSRKVLEPFGVGHKNDYVLTPAFIGRLPVALPNEEVVSIRNGSVFDIVLKIHFKLFTKIGKFKTERDGQMACYLKVPFSVGGNQVPNLRAPSVLSLDR